MIQVFDILISSKKIVVSSIAGTAAELIKADKNIIPFNASYNDVDDDTDDDDDNDLSIQYRCDDIVTGTINCYVMKINFDDFSVNADDGNNTNTTHSNVSYALSLTF